MATQVGILIIRINDRNSTKGDCFKSHLIKRLFDIGEFIS